MGNLNRHILVTEGCRKFKFSEVVFIIVKTFWEKTEQKFFLPESHLNNQYILLSVEATLECKRFIYPPSFMPEAEFSTLFEVLGLALEGEKSFEMSCPRLKHSCIIFWLIEKENNQTKNNPNF